jgi:cell wall hydrolase
VTKTKARYRICCKCYALGRLHRFRCLVCNHMYCMECLPATEDKLMTIEDQFLLELTIWRENRGGGITGMQSVANVILNRAKRDNTDVYDECVERLQFSSITAKNDPELILWPGKKANKTWDDNDQSVWQEAQNIRIQAVAGTLQDITNGATLYYAPNSITGHEQVFTLPSGQEIPWPKGWDQAKVKYEALIADQVFFQEV